MPTRRSGAECEISTVSPDIASSLWQGTTCGASATNGNQPATDVLLVPLDFSCAAGTSLELTRTHDLDPTSPARDTGVPLPGGNAFMDQRTVLRPQGLGTDIGAVEHSLSSLSLVLQGRLRARQHLRLVERSGLAWRAATAKRCQGGADEAERQRRGASSVERRHFDHRGSALLRPGAARERRRAGVEEDPAARVDRGGASADEVVAVVGRREAQAVDRVLRASDGEAGNSRSAIRRMADRPGPVGCHLERAEEGVAELAGRDVVGKGEADDGWGDVGERAGRAAADSPKRRARR